MTREDAIKTLKELRRETNDIWYEEVYNMAINALEADYKIEPQLMTKCLNCANGGSYKCSKCDGEIYFKYEPKTCETCKFEWFEPECDSCSDTYSNWQSKNEPQTERSK